MGKEQGGEPSKAAPPEVWPYHVARPRTSRQQAKAPPKPCEPPEGTPKHPWGICLSGGGVRSASFCLGALQAMQRRFMLLGPPEDRATYLSAVSGGSYIAGAYSLLARQLQPDTSDDPLIPAPPIVDVPPYDRALQLLPDKDPQRVLEAPDQIPAEQTGRPVTPEECYLRDHTLYLPRGPGGAPGAMWHLTLGILWNLIVLNLSIFVVATVGGWLAQWAYRGYPTLFRFGSVPPAIHTPGRDWLILIALGGGALLFGLFALMGPYKRGAAAVERISRILLLFAGAWFAVIGLPYAVAALRWVFGTYSAVPAGTAAVTSTVTSTAVSTVTSTVTSTVGAGATSTVAATVGQTAHRVGAVAGAGGILSLGTAMAMARRLWAPKVRSGAGSKAWAFVNKHRSASLNLAASIAGPLMILGGFLVAALAAAGSAAAGGHKMQVHVMVWAGGVIVLAVLWFLADLNAWSPHSYYYQRLASVFAVGRQMVGTPDPRLHGSFDDSGIVHWPDADGEAVAALPWRLDAAEVALSDFQAEHFPEVLICACATVSDYGSVPTGFNATSFVFSQRLVGGPMVGAVPTSKYLAALGAGNAINLPEAVSIAGAAVAPEMGKMTRKPLRFFLTMANLRLGVWIINPRHIDPSNPGRRQPRIPRFPYLFREMMGSNHLDAPYLYVSDGGHYENLGLVEQLRRRCEWVFCIDAAGDSVTTFHTLGEAIALARAELGVDVRIMPETDMAPAPDEEQHPGGPDHKPWVTKAYCCGTIHYPDRTEPGHLVYIKAGVPADGPWDVKNYAEEHTLFPTDPTSDQLFDAERVEAYRALGEFVTEGAVTACWPAFSAWKAARP